MNLSYHDENEHIDIEKKAQELGGYDDATLMREAVEAERQWEQEKAANPAEADKLELEAKVQFGVLMSKIHAEGIKPVSERGYERQRKLDNRKPRSVRKINKKVVCVLAAAAIMVVGGSMVSTARGMYRYGAYPTQFMKNDVLRYNTAFYSKQGTLEEAYEKISKELHIPVLTLGAIPDEMRYKKSTIDNMGALLEFDYQGGSVFLQELAIVQDENIVIYKSDRPVYKQVYNELINLPVDVQKNILSDGKVEFEAIVKSDIGYYSFEGKMEEQKFLEIVTSFMFNS